MDKRVLVDELHRGVRRNFPRRRVLQKGINDTWQADLVEMINYSHMNKGFKYILTVIDIFSKFAYAVPLKDKNGVTVTSAMKTIFELNSKKIPKNLHTDQGKEFFNSHFNSLMQKYKINHYHTYSTMKASIVERFNRTLKNKMWKYFSLSGHYKWIISIKEIVNEYNNSIHSTIRMKPKDVNKKNEKELLKTVYNNIKIHIKGKYNIGDLVRISKNKTIFDKGYLPNWTTEVFKIMKRHITNPVTYTLIDLEGNEISGKFYETELQLTQCSNTYLIERVLKTKGNRIFVKWLGFDNTKNSWINKSELISS